MKEYAREYPYFSLCGLNCGLCPRHQTQGASKCPGCGGKDFHVKHPSCAVITCSQKHGGVQYCFECGAYPCERYRKIGETDSFITYWHVVSDMEKAKAYGIEPYKAEMNEKMGILEFLLERYNDGRRKNFYCLAVNLLELSDLHDVMEEIKADALEDDPKAKIEQTVSLLEAKADERHAELRLRK